MNHALQRTSKKGGPFIGTCMNCGRPNLTLEDAAREECENPRGATQEQTLVDAILGDLTNPPEQKP